MVGRWAYNRSWLPQATKKHTEELHASGNLARLFAVTHAPAATETVSIEEKRILRWFLIEVLSSWDRLHLQRGFEMCASKLEIRFYTSEIRAWSLLAKCNSYWMEARLQCDITKFSLKCSKQSNLIEQEWPDKEPTQSSCIPTKGLITTRAHAWSKDPIDPGTIRHPYRPWRHQDQANPRADSGHAAENPIIGRAARSGD